MKKFKVPLLIFIIDFLIFVLIANTLDTLQIYINVATFFIELTDFKLNMFYWDYGGFWEAVFITFYLLTIGVYYLVSKSKKPNP